MNSRPDSASEPVALPLTASGVGGDTNPRAPTAPAAAHAFLSPAQQPDELGRLGTYRVLAELGRGGMGVVFRAEDTHLRRQVALKAMLPDVAADARAVARFLREARAQAAVEHEHVAVIHYVGEANGVPFIAMPLLKGQTLGAALKQNPRPPLNELVRIGREAAEGLAAAHAVGLVHRDIKPANIWLDGPKRRVRILDFGLARTEAPAGGDDEQLTGRGAILGTPAFMSPEQAKGEPVDARSDLFSLGVVLYQMATGALPFAGANTLAVLFAVAEQHPPAAHEVAPDVPLPLSELIWRLMSKAPAGRPASAAAVAAELDALENGLSASRAQVLPLVSVVEAPTGPDPWADLTASLAPVEGDDEGDDTEYDEPPRPVAKRKPRWVWPVAGAALALVGVAAVLVAVTSRPKAVAEKAAEIAPPKLPPVVIPPPKPKAEPDPLTPKPVAPNAPELTAENRKALEWVLSVGGSLHLLVDGTGVAVPTGAKLPAGPFEVQDVDLTGAAGVTERALDDFRAVPPVRRNFLLANTGIGDAELAKLVTFPGAANAPSVNLAGTKITDAGLAHVGQLTALVYLDLGNTKVTGAGLAHLRGLKLTNLSLHLCPVGDDGMDHLADMTSLTHLWLMYTGVTDAGVAKLTKLTNLTYLQPGTITDAGIDTLLGFRQLIDLQLINTKVTAAGLKRLAVLPLVTQIDLANTPLADADLVVFQDFPALKSVSFHNNKERITDAGLVHLAECPGLRHINLKDTRVTDDGVKALSEKLPLCQILWKDREIKPKPLLEVTQRCVAALLKSGVEVRMPVGGKFRGLTPADELAATDRLHQIAIGILPDRDPLRDPAVVEILRTFPAESWREGGPVVSLSGAVTRDHLRVAVRAAGLRNANQWEIWDGSVPDEALAELTAHPRASGLALINAASTDATLKHVPAGPRFTRLTVTGAKLTSAGLAALRDRSYVLLDLNKNPGIDDDAVEHLGTLRKLQNIELKGTKITKTGVEKLASALPRCRITWDGGAVEPRSVLGYGLEFDGRSAHVTFPTLKYDGSHPITLEGWFAQTGPIVGKQSLFIDIQSAGIGLYLRPDHEGGWQYGGMVHTGGAYQHARSPGPSGRVLTHLATVYDGKGQLRLFVDGKLTATAEAPGAFRASPLAFMLGANPGVGNRADGEFFEGTVAGVRVSKGARYTADFAPRFRFDPDADTLALYHCDQDTGDVLTDSSGNNHHGTIVGAKWAAADEREVAANRRGAEKLNPHVDLTVALPGGKWQLVPKGGKLPDGAFTVVRMFIPPGDWPGAFVDDVFMPAMADLRSVRVIESQTWVLQPSDAQLARLAAMPVAESLTYLACGFSLSPATLDTLKRFPHLEVLRCRADVATDAVLEQLARLPRLDQLALEHLGKSGQVTARGLAAVSKLPVRQIGLSSAAAAAEYVKLAPGHAGLTHLVLWSAPVTDDDIRPLARCPELESVKLDATRVTDAGLKHLEGLHRLRYVGLTKTKVTDAGARALAAKLPRCKIEWDGGATEPVATAADRKAAEYTLSVGGKVTIWQDGVEKSLAAKDPLPPGPWTLVGVNLADTKVTDAGLAAFAGCTDLTALSIGYTGVGDSGFAHFKDCKKLKQLLAGSTRITDAGFAHFKDCKGLAHCGITNTQITDASLDVCKGLPALAALDTRNTRVTAAGAKGLAAALPACRIEWGSGAAAGEVLGPKK